MVERFCPALFLLPTSHPREIYRYVKLQQV
jgi:hypothetical protein